MNGCPWCGADIVPLITSSGAWDFYYDPAWASEEEGDCPVCSKPIKVKARTSVTFDVEKNDREMEKQLALYEKRMKGDWS